jgi:hypothetical protein
MIAVYFVTLTRVINAPRKRNAYCLNIEADDKYTNGALRVNYSVRPLSTTSNFPNNWHSALRDYVTVSTLSLELCVPLSSIIPLRCFRTKFLMTHQRASLIIEHAIDATMAY